MHEQVGSVKIDQKLVGYLENGSGISSNKLKIIKKLFILNRRQHSVIVSIAMLLLSVTHRAIGRRA